MSNSPFCWRAVACLTLLISTSTIASAWIGMTPGPASEALAQAMHQVDESTKTLSKGVNAENREQSLLEIAKLETALMNAKALTPDSAAKVEEKKRAGFVNDFKKTLVEALQFTLTAETAILDGKYKEADTVIRNKLGGIKSTGHGKFKTDEGK